MLFDALTFYTRHLSPSRSWPQRKGIKLKKPGQGGASEKCVVYIDVAASTFYRAEMKHDEAKEAFWIHDIRRVEKHPFDNLIAVIALEDSSKLYLEFTKPKVGSAERVKKCVCLLVAISVPPSLFFFSPETRDQTLPPAFCSCAPTWS